MNAFIAIEGIDGAGTTTQTATLVTALEARGHAAHGTREPSDGPVGKHLRELLSGRSTTEGASETQRAAQLALLFAADRLDHLGREVLPRLSEGAWVISDRYDHSSVAYQSVTSGDPSSITWLRELNRYADRPHLTIVLDVSADVARTRRLARSAERELFDDDTLQQQLASFYRDLDRHFPGERIVHVDADRGREAVARDVLAAALALIPA
jgi:dTMP kinase